MPVVNASCPTCPDGVVSITVSGPNRPYRFRISGGSLSPQPLTPAGTTDVQTGVTIPSASPKSKVYKGLLPGIYIIEVIKDSTLLTENCIETFVVQISDGCPPEIKKCIECGHSLKFVPAGSIIEGQTGPNYVRFRDTSDDYWKSPLRIGRGDFTISMWLKLDFYNIRSEIFVWDDLNKTAGDRTNNFVRVSWIELSPASGGPGNTTISAGKYLVAWIGGQYNSSYTTLIRAAGLAIPRAFFSFDKFYYIVWTKTTRDHNNWKLYVDGSEYPAELVWGTNFGSAYSGGDFLGPDGEHADDLDLNNPKSRKKDIVLGALWSNTDETPNINYYTPTISTHFDTVNGIIYPSPSFSITNLQMYSRVLYRDEVVLNYISGCHGEPYDCSKLLLHAPLNQESGYTTPELANGFDGELINFGLRAYINGGAWNSLCCNPITDIKSIDCYYEECEKDHALLSFTIENPTNVGDTNVKISILFNLDSCPPHSYLAEAPPGTSLSLTLNGNPVPPETAAINFGNNFVNAFNALDPEDRWYGVAYSVLDRVYIKIPLNVVIDGCTVYQDFCNKPYVICLYDTSDPNFVYSGPFSICLHRGYYAICCVPDEVCVDDLKPTV